MWDCNYLSIELGICDAVNEMMFKQTTVVQKFQYRQGKHAKALGALTMRITGADSLTV